MCWFATFLYYAYFRLSMPLLCKRVYFFGTQLLYFSVLLSSVAVCRTSRIQFESRGPLHTFSWVHLCHTAIEELAESRADKIYFVARHFNSSNQLTYEVLSARGA
jgi:hypothetical protein